MSQSPLNVVALVTAMPQIWSMSGQPYKKELAAAFNALMELLERMFADDAPFLPFSDKFVMQYEKSGSLDWHEFYALDEWQLSVELFENFGGETWLYSS